MAQTQLNAANQLGGSVSVQVATFTSSAGQTTFSVAPSSFAGSPMLEVFVGGVLLTLTTDYTLSGNNTVTLNTALASGVIVNIKWFNPSFNIGTNATSVGGFSAQQLIAANTAYSIQQSMLWGK